MKIAVIGAGAGGTSFCYNLLKHTSLDPNLLEIHVYEREAVAGGRAKTIPFAGIEIEVGGTIVHSSNEMVNELMAYTGAVESVSGLNLDGKEETMGFFDGEKTYLVVKNSTISFALNFIKAFGPFSVWNFRSHALKAVNAWKKVYPMQANGDFWESPEAMLKALKIFETEQISLNDYYAKHFVSREFADKCASAIIRNMYTQTADVNALAGQVGLAGAGLAGGHLFGIGGGNWTLFSKTLEKLSNEHNLHLHFNSAVSNFKRVENSVQLEVNGKSEKFDALIIAAPLELSGLQTNFPMRKFQKVQVTLIAGTLNPEFFGGGKLSSTYFTSKGIEKSIGIAGLSAKGTRIYKIFSDDPVPESRLKQIFTSIDEFTEFTWPGAYPILDPASPLPPFELEPNIYYCNGFETAASSIEVNAISAKNLAQLFASSLK